MVGNGPGLISAVVERLKPDDIELLLANRGLPSVGPVEELSKRLQAALVEEMCEWRWEKGTSHAEIIAAGARLVEHRGSVYAFGGMDEERNEHMGLWRWDLGSGFGEGFQAVSYRGPVPQTFAAGSYAAVYKEDLWVFPGPRNHMMRNVYCCDLARYRWVERAVQGEPPSETQMRRNIECFVREQELVVIGGAYMDRVYVFDFETRHWTKRKAKTPGEIHWSFGGSCLWKNDLYAYGSSKRISDEPVVEVWKLDLNEWSWSHVSASGSTPPPYRIHASSAVVGSKWIVHGGRRPNMSKFNVSDQTFVFDLAAHKWSILMAEGHQPVAREWHTALGVGGKMVVIGGRVDIPDYEPIPLSFDTMCMDVEILHFQESPPPSEPTGRANVLWIYRKLYNNLYLSDVTLVVGGVRVPAHCHVLATHSSVFERMWDCWMKEAQTREVVIEDVPFETMMCLVQYMYGVLEEIPQDHRAVVDLFKVADKYNVRGLVNECVVVFRKLTRDDTLAPLLEVAEERSNQELRNVCEDIASKHVTHILVTDSFKDLTQRKPDLTLPFISQVLSKILPKDHGGHNPELTVRVRKLDQ